MGLGVPCDHAVDQNSSRDSLRFRKRNAFCLLDAVMIERISCGMLNAAVAAEFVKSKRHNVHVSSLAEFPSCRRSAVDVTSQVSFNTCVGDAGNTSFVAGYLLWECCILASL